METGLAGKRVLALTMPAEQGFGPRLKSTADDVLARLNAKRTQAA